MIQIFRVFAVAALIAYELPGLAAPALPPGLESMTKSQVPALPPGLEINDPDTTETQLEPAPSISPWSLNGFGESRIGSRTRQDPDQKSNSIAEGRMRLSADYAGEVVGANLTADLLADTVADSGHVSLNRGTGWLDLREAWVQMSLSNYADMKVGRQVLTWGVGDLVFINDLFPKDWHSFFIGRDTEYLKAPSDALKLAFYFEPANLDVVYVPRADMDRFIDGSRLSFYNPVLGKSTGRSDPITAVRPGHHELSLRLHRNVSSFEYALYAYDGFWKSPAGFDPEDGRFTFPQLRVLGASLRGSFMGGIVSGELGFYDSRDDSDGSDPLVNNSESRLLLGYERELVSNLSAGFQVYLERIEDYRAYRSTLPIGAVARDEIRRLFTTRLTWLAMNQNVTTSLFIYLSPTDDDWYARSSVSYKVNDRLMLAFGVNHFGGDTNTSFFGQFKTASNVYAALRYSY